MKIELDMDCEEWKSFMKPMFHYFNRFFFGQLLEFHWNCFMFSFLSFSVAFQTTLFFSFAVSFRSWELTFSWMSCSNKCQLLSLTFEPSFATKTLSWEDIVSRYGITLSIESFFTVTYWEKKFEKNWSLLIRNRDCLISIMICVLKKVYPKKCTQKVGFSIIG